MSEEEVSRMKLKEKRGTAESLGWLTESAVMPKKHRSIQGVGASSILELKAQLYRTQEEARRNNHDGADFLRARTKIDDPDVFSRKNSGVESRANRDKLELKAVNDGSASYAALQRKAEIYEKLCRGELPDEDETYCVDFFRKSTVQSEQPIGGSSAHESGDGCSAHDEEADLEAIVLAEKLIGPGRGDAIMDRNEHKRFVREVHEEASEAREKVTEIKTRRREQEATRRERLRQAYLRKRLEKLKASSQVEPT